MNYGLFLFFISWIISGILNYGLMNAFFLSENKAGRGKNHYRKTLIYISALGYVALVAALIFLYSNRELLKHGFTIKDS